MSSKPPLLEGTVVERKDDGMIYEMDRLRETNRNLTHDLSAALNEIEQLKSKLRTANAPVDRLREKLGPFYRLLQSVFGDIDEISPGEPSRQGDCAASSPIWDSWKTRLSGAPAKIIDALLLHSEATVEQLVVLTQISRKQTIYDAIHRMNKAGIINKNGNKFGLKSLT